MSTILPLYSGELLLRVLELDDIEEFLETNNDAVIHEGFNPGKSEKCTD